MRERGNAIIIAESTINSRARDKKPSPRAALGLGQFNIGLVVNQGAAEGTTITIDYDTFTTVCLYPDRTTGGFVDGI